MSIERNAPCPCGSGKKYKKCCLAKDETARQEERAKAQAAVVARTLPSPYVREPKTPKPPDPFMEAWNERWEEFDEADYEARIALFTQTLEEGELMDAEMVSEMTSRLFDQAIEHNERDRFDALIEQLRERLPKVFDEQAHWLIAEQIKNALALGRFEKVPTLVQQMTPLIAPHIDNWNALEEELAYFGQLDALLQAMRVAWPAVQRSADIVPWGKDEFALRGSQYEFLGQIEQAPNTGADDPVFQERVRFFLDDDFDAPHTAESMNWVSGKMTRAWALTDFAFIPAHQAKKAERQEANRLPGENLNHLIQQFTHHLHHECSLSLVKADMAAQKLLAYLIRRREGELEAKGNFFQPTVKQFQPVTHPLCPDRHRLDLFLTGDFGFLSLCRYAAFALVEITPLWVRFLISQGLMETEAGEQALRSLKQITKDMVPLIGNEIDKTQLFRHWDTVS